VQGIIGCISTEYMVNWIYSQNIESLCVAEEVKLQLGVEFRQPICRPPHLGLYSEGL
jgi:hypothetical protein